jgi:hypothetical protein
MSLAAASCPPLLQRILHGLMQRQDVSWTANPIPIREVVDQI